MIVYGRDGVRWPPSMATEGPHAARVLASGSASSTDNLFSSFACGKPSVSHPSIPRQRYKWHPPPANAPEWWGLETDLLVDVLSQLPVRQILKLRWLSVNTRQCSTRALERALEMSPEQAAAFCDAVCGRNVFLSGGAGKLLNLEPCPTACTAHQLCCPA